VRILLLSREYPPHVYGGAGVVVDHLSRALAHRASVEVRCFGDRDLHDLPLAVEQAQPNLTIRGYAPWPRLAGGPEAPYAPALEALSVGLAMARDPVVADVVHTHTWYVGLGGMLVQSIHDVPLVVTLHSMEPLRPWKADQLGTGYAVSSWAERLAVERADRVIAVSAQMRADITTHFRVDPDRVVVIHNGVDAEAFARTEQRDALARHGVHAPYVLFVGRISEQKGIFQLLEAARALPAGVQLVLCASSPDTPELLARLEAAVTGRPEIRWINAMLPVPEVVQLYSHAAVFVCPSIYEPFGLINLEAMACGTPVVASRVGGIPEVVVDGETGYLRAVGDVDAMANAALDLLSDEPKRLTFAAAGRKLAVDRFAQDVIVGRYRELYVRVVADANA
jgi:starch synthase